MTTTDLPNLTFAINAEAVSRLDEPTAAAVARPYRTELSPVSFLRRSAYVFPDKVAIVHGERRTTYREFDERANRLAHHLCDAGVAPGDPVAVLSWNRAEWVEAELGIYKARASVINVNYRYVADELRYMLQNSDTRALIFERKFNGFEVAMRRLGRRVYISEPDFFEWLEKRGPGASTTRRLRAERPPRAVAVLEHAS